MLKFCINRPKIKKNKLWNTVIDDDAKLYSKS